MKTLPHDYWPSSRMDRTILGRERRKNECFGVYRHTIAGQAAEEGIRSVAQDGGAVTALLLHGLRTGVFSVAVVSGVDSNKPLRPVPKVASNSDEILACAGTRYTYSPNLLALAPAAEKGNAVAFVGTPCQINAVRKMQANQPKKYGSVKLLIGLMCSECLDYEAFVEKHLQKELGINLRDIVKTRIKGKMTITMKEGQTIELPLTEIKRYARKSCRLCPDFSSELADISVGGLGLEGWSFLVVRSEKGEKLFLAAKKAGIIQTRNTREEKNALTLLCKLSSKKTKIALGASVLSN